ncbi:MAG: hypothetical protein ACFCUJ_08030 [Thiotrichales bacterium]
MGAMLRARRALLAHRTAGFTRVGFPLLPRSAAVQVALGALELFPARAYDENFSKKHARGTKWYRGNVATYFQSPAVELPSNLLRLLIRHRGHGFRDTRDALDTAFRRIELHLFDGGLHLKVHRGILHLRLRRQHCAEVAFGGADGAAKFTTHCDLLIK